jgi:ribosome maturation factor RimP
MPPTSIRARLAEVLEPVVGRAGYDLEDVVVTPAGKRRLLRVVVDRDGGVSLDDVAELSRATAAALDESDVMGAQPYVLEVSSPGVDRPLTEPRHWRRAVGRLVKVAMRDGTSATGRVVGATDTTVTLDTANGPTDLATSAIARGVVQVEFDRSGGADVDDGDDVDDDDDTDDTEPQPRTEAPA